jgi:uncharacterized protein YggU (UPF0235/DUF167 family)
MARIALLVRPGSRRDALRWEPWRRRWVVDCRARAEDGAANRSVSELIAGWLSVPASSVRWIRAGRSTAKVNAVEGLTDDEVAERLRVHLRPDPDREGSTSDRSHR